MTDKKEVSILLLGIVAILAIVGLVLLFTSPAATGKAFFPPPLPPEVSVPAPVGYQVSAQQVGQTANAVYVSALEGANLARCPNGKVRTREQGNIRYDLKPGYACLWFYCPELLNSPDPAAGPLLACQQMSYT